MARAKNMGALLATDDDDEVPALKPRSKAAKAAAAAEAVGSDAAPIDPNERRVRIVLEENDNIPPTGQFISGNGRTFVLRPGEEADVPMTVINILNDAIQSVPQIDPSTRQVVAYRSRLRFPYRVIQPVV